MALADAVRGRRVPRRFPHRLIGAPNAGKSTLLNALAERDAAIVTSTPGTTPRHHRGSADPRGLQDTAR